MTDIKALVARCKEIIKKGEEMFNLPKHEEKIKRLTK